MFETVIALFIKRYVARYFDLNADQLSTQLLYKQQITIDNLTLNQTAFNDDLQKKFKIPIQIHSLTVGKIQCSFILSSLFFRSSSPALIIKIEGIQAIIGSPTMEDEQSLWQTSTEEDAMKKQRQLNLAEQQLEKEFECFGEVKSSRWNVQRLLTSFLEKVQIDIVDVHIRYQSSALCTIGFTCQSIHISNKSSDESLSQQVLQVINPGLYIDANSSSIHSYILSPTTSMEIALTHNHFLVRQKEYRYELECSLDDLTMKCTVEQVRILADMIRSVQHSSLRHMLLSDSSRPRTKISKQSARAWWYYAILTVLRMHASSNTKLWFNRTRLIDRLNQLIRYQRIYRLYLENKYFQSLNFSPQAALAMNELEQDFDLTHLLIIRRSIFQKRISEHPSMQTKETTKWYSTYAKWITTKVMDWWEKAPTTENTNATLNENDLQVQEQVNNFIAESLEDEDRSESCLNAQIIRLKFVLRSIQIDLSSSNNELLFRAHLNNLSVLIELRLRHRSMLTSISLGDLYIRDPKQVDEFANVISSKESAQQVPVFEFFLEKKGRSRHHKQSIYNISIRSCGLCLVCSPVTMERLRHLYSLICGASTQSLSLSFDNWRKIKHYATRNVISIWERIVPTPTVSYWRREKKKYQIHINMGAPKVVIPLSAHGALIVDLGCVILSNDIAQQQQPEEEDEFLTPDTSPLANDMPLEEETNFYSMNTIPTDIQYSSLTLSVCDIQVGYSVDLSQIVEKFSVHFQLQHPLDHLWPLTHVSCAIPKLSLDLTPQLIRTLVHSIQPWIVFGNNLAIQHHSPPPTWPQLHFCLEQVNIRLSDATRALCDIRLQNIDLSGMNDSPTRQMTLALPSLTVSDLLLKTDSRIIGLTAHFSHQERQLVADVNIDQLHYIFNPELVGALMNLSPSIKSMELQLQNLALNISTNPSLTCQMKVTALEIVNLLTIDKKVSQHAALSLSLKMGSISFNPSMGTIHTVRQMVDYLSKNGRQANFIDSISNIDIESLKLGFPAGVDLQLTPVRISNSPTRTSNYTINIDRMLMMDHLLHRAAFPLVENIIVSLNLQMPTSPLNIHSEILSPLRIYLSQHRIKTLQKILNTTSGNTTSPASSFAFHLRVAQIILILQTDHLEQVTIICETTLNHCQMALESEHSRRRTISLQLDSLQTNQSLLMLTSLKLVGDLHQQININLGKVNIQFVPATWKILSEIIAVIPNTGISEQKNQPKQISITVDAVACLFRNDRMTIMSIDVQRLAGQIISSTVQGRLNSISVRDLTTSDQLYGERLRTNCIVFNMIREDHHGVNRSKIDLRLTAIQYIYTQHFLLHLIDYFNHCRSSTVKPMISQIDQRWKETLLNIQLENITLILPEHISQTPILVLQLGHIYFQNQLNLSMSIGIKDLELYSSLWNGSASRNPSLMITRQPCHLNMTIESNSIRSTSPTLIINIHLSALDLLFDFNHYRLIENIVTFNQNNVSKSLIAMKKRMSTELACVVEIEYIALEIFMLEQRRSVGHAILTNLHLSFDQYPNGNHVVHLLCSTLRLIDTRTQQEHMILPLSIPSNATQLEIQLSKTKNAIQCTITMNSMRFLVVIDWLLALNEFLNLFCHGSKIATIDVSPPSSLELAFNLNRFELILVPSTKDPYASALVYSSTMAVKYRETRQPLECHLTDLSFSTCQIGNIDETTVPIIEPTDCFLTIQPSPELSNQQVCHLNIPKLNMRFAYLDVHMLYSLVHTMIKQINEAKTRKPLLTFFSSVLTSPLRRIDSSAFRFLSMQCLKLISDEMCLCLIDDCSGVNIPLLNIHLKPFLLHTIEYSHVNRTDQAQFGLNISYYNRFQSGFEPLIEQCSLQMTLTRSTSSTLLYLSSNEIFHLNFTKAMYRLISTVKTNWSADYQNTKKIVAFRRVKPLDPYCFQNLLGVPIKFRTWMITEQRFSSFENTVDDHQTVSFSFSRHSTESNSRQRANSLVTSLFQSDRRLQISIDGWERLQPISIDRVGTFFRLAKPSHDHPLHKPILIMIDIAMTDSTIRLITIRSSIEIRNRLRTSVDLRLISRECSLLEFCLESKESRSLPLQVCCTLQELQIRPANFALDYCDESIQWSDIEKNSSLKEKAELRQSFLRSCSISGKDAVYYACLQSKQTCLLTHANQSLSLYQLTILPPLTICNLLPCTLTFEIPFHPQKFELLAYQTHREHTVSIGESLDILFATGVYRMQQPLHLSTNNNVQQRVIFHDLNQRELLVDLTVESNIEHRLKITVSVPYILLNKSGIPLIFKDVNGKIEAAGQSADDESSVNREPLLFSFENVNRNKKCLMRVGSGLHRHQDGQPQWSQPFSIEHGSTHQQLQVRSPTRTASDWYYSIAIDIRPGEGILKNTNFIFFTARHVVCNQSSYDLLIAQRPLKDDKSTYLRICKQATNAYHWPRVDMEKLLCVRAIDDHQYELVNWSGGFSVDDAQVLHINMRFVDGQCLILRVQVIKRNGTHFIVFTDSNKMLPPFRIVNRSNVPILFYQSEIREEYTYLRTTIQRHQSMDYAWDEPTLKPLITCVTPDGSKGTYDPLKLDDTEDLNYQNYIHIAFQDTFPDENLMQFSSDAGQSLVIEYSNKKLVLARQQKNKRSQLWHMTNNGLLVHVESSPSIQNSTYRHALVLDIEDLKDTSLSGLSGRFSTLAVRRYDPKRSVTQTWQWLENGYLCLANTQLCVQVFGELKENADVVLGSIVKNQNQPPVPTMHIRSRPQYDGSGLLSVRVIADGPISVLEIDHKGDNNSSTKLAILPRSSTIYHFDLHFPAGLGVSLVGSIGHEAEELLYVFVNDLHVEYDDKDHERAIDARIENVIISNQLLTATKTCLFYATFTEDSPIPSAIRLQINWQKYNKQFALPHIIHSFYLHVNSISIQMEELLLWKLIDFFDIEISSLSTFVYNDIKVKHSDSTDRPMDLKVNDYEIEHILALLTSTQSTQVYFHKLYLSTINLNLSISSITSKRSLPPHLLAIKRRAAFPVVSFENAQMHLKSYEQTHVFNTRDFFLLSILTHYVHGGKRQAYKIVGAVNYLGNPLGLIHDVTDGLTCLTDERGMTGLVKNVTHGVADSTSKVTGSLSYGIGKLVPDRNRRPSVKETVRNPTLGHTIRHGTAGLAAGFYGGLTSIIKQPYKGVVEDGASGLFKGIGKGIVGTVSRPVVGILDFTNEMATAIKESARSANTILDNRLRLPRCPCNTLGLLQSYSLFDAQGHYLLHRMNKKNATERYISRFILSTANNPRYTNAMITSERVILYQTDESDPDQFQILRSYDFHTPLILLPNENRQGPASVEILLHSTSSIYPCDTFEQASLFIREVQHAQDLFEEEKLIYINSSADQFEDSDE